ncbi:MAG TPA: thioesterase family protein [Candidatus Elarobacter sp.]
MPDGTETPIRAGRDGTETPIRVGPDVRDRVRWSDVDVMGIVYYGRYLRFMEAAETEFFRALGYSYDRIADELGVWIARIRLECDYRAPAKLDDEIVCRAELRKIGASSMTFTFPIERSDGARLVDGMLVLAALDRTTLRATRIPEPLRAAFQPAE